MNMDASGNKGSVPPRLGGRSVINMWAGGFLLLGVILVWAHGTGFPVALMWSVACLGLGGLLGFLFGIPRSATININQPGVAAVNARVGEVTTSDHPAQPPAPSSGPSAPDAGTAASVNVASIPTNAGDTAAVANTTGQRLTNNTRESNLEQVSDWVTKLLLGGTLTQIANIPGTMANWGTYVASGLGDKPNPANQAFATAMIIYFLVLGFVAGYVITKVELGTALIDK